MRVHAHTKFCVLCVLAFLLNQFSHGHEDVGHRHTDDENAHNDLQISEAPYLTRGTPSPDSKILQGDALEEEQHFYIRQLFRRYGKKDKLDFQGFQNLLLSLGLGEIKVVEMDHEDLGHDHVAHLDILDIQGGHHSHESTGHHGHTNPKTEVHHPHHHGDPKPCNETTVPSPTGGSDDHEHHHDHHHHHHHHDHDHGQETKHNHDHPHNHTDGDQKGQKHSRGHVQDTHNHSDHTYEEKHEQVHNHSDHEHDHKTQLSTDIPPNKQLPASQVESTRAPQGRQATPSPVEKQTRKPRKSGRARGQGGRGKTPSHSGDHGHQHDHDHDHQHDHDHSHNTHVHKDKREAPGAVETHKALDPTGHGGLSHQHEECLNLTQLLDHYGLSSESLISPSQFTYLCPALLYQIDSRVCIRHFHQMDVEQELLPPVSSVWIWTWGFVSITIISLLSLLGVVLVPILNQSCFKFLLTFLVALAVGTLSGDALLHLLPHSQGQHDHGEDGHHHGSEEEESFAVKFDGVWKGLTALSGIYFLFIMEHCIGMLKHYKDRKALRKGKKDGTIGRKLSDHKLNRRSDAEWLHLKPLNEEGDPDSSAHNDTQLTGVQTHDSPTKTPLNAKKQVQQKSPEKSKHHGHGHSHGGNCHSDQEMKDAGIASIAWMVIMGDGMHNFSDGLAIGAAFSANITGGISTSVAVFCHELPHELGDFAVLLKAGMSVKQAIVYNVLSALMAYVGMIIGTAVGQYTHNVTNWIFAITAGMFLYVALVDMLPEMLHGDSEEDKRYEPCHFLLQNVGMLTGFGIMLIIAIFEDQIVLDFGF